MIECKLKKLIHVRSLIEREDTDKFSIEITCETHHARWICTVPDWGEAIATLDAFPLVTGGISFNDRVKRMHECILHHIPANRVQGSHERTRTIKRLKLANKRKGGPQ